MRQLYIFLILTFATTAHAQSMNKMNIDQMGYGCAFAASSIDDPDALGGFGSSENMPISNVKALDFYTDDVFLYIDTTRRAYYREHIAGYELVLGNGTELMQKLNAQDSRLTLLAQALIDGEWQNIEKMPRSWCGNSYHSVYLGTNEYWTFNVPEYTGMIQTKIRYQLLSGYHLNPKTALEEPMYIYSNEIDGRINPGQLVQEP